MIKPWKLIKSQLTFGHEYHNGGRFCVWRAARIIPRICINRISNCEMTLSFRPGIRFDRYPSPGSIVIDHSIVVIPEHILGRLGTLKKRKKKKNSLQTPTFWLETRDTKNNRSFGQIKADKKREKKKTMFD